MCYSFLMLMLIIMNGIHAREKVDGQIRVSAFNVRPDLINSNILLLFIAKTIRTITLITILFSKESIS